jgi:hypothetical protein
MPSAAETFVANGMDAPQAVELARLIGGTSTAEWLVSIGFPYPLAVELARQMATGNWKADYLIALGVPPGLATAIVEAGLAVGGPVEVTPFDALIPTDARMDTHVMPLRMLLSEEIATSIASPGGDVFSIGAEGKALFTSTNAPAVAGGVTVTVNILNELTGATRTSSVEIEVRTAIPPLTYYYAAVAQGTGDGTSAANASLFTAATCAANIATAYAAGRPAEHLLIDDHGTIARSTGTVTIPAAGTSEMTRQRIRGINAAGVPTRTLLTGGRIAAPTTNQSLSYMFVLTNDCSFISFEDLSLTNVSCFCSARGRGQALGIPSFHREIEYKRFTVNNCYRLCLHMDTSGTVGFILGHEGVRFWDIDIDYLGHSALKGINIHRVDARRCTANGRAVSQTNNYPAMFDFHGSFGGGSTRYDICTRLAFDDIDGYDIIDHQFSYCQGDTLQFDSAKFTYDGVQAGIGGDTLYTESDGTTIADYVRVRTIKSARNADGGIDAKVAGLVVNGLEVINGKRGLRDWGTNPFKPYRVRDMRIWNPRMPTSPGSGDSTNSYFAAIDNQNTWLYAPLFYSRAAGLVVQDGTARAMLGAENTTIMSGDTGRGNTDVDLLYDGSMPGWGRINSDTDDVFYGRGGAPPGTGWVGISDPTFPTPVPAISWRSGFESGGIPDGTLTGTVVADLADAPGVVTSGGSPVAVAGLVAEYLVQTDPDSVFEIAGTPGAYTLRLRADIDYATKASHNFTLRAVPGIVGADAWRDAADNLTWQCWLGGMYVDLPAVAIVTGAEEAETTAFFDAADTDDIDITSVTTVIRAKLNTYIRNLKDAGIWSTFDVLPWLWAPTLALALRDLKGNHHATVNGGVTKPIALGGFLSDGTTGFLSWDTYTPNVGPGWTRDSATAYLDVEIDLQTTNAFFSMGSSTCLTILAPRATSTQSQFRINTTNSTNGSISASGATGVWSVERSGGSVAALRQNDVSRGSSALASVAIPAGALPLNKPRLFSNTGGTTFAAHGGSAIGWGSLHDSTQRAAMYAAIAAYKTVMAQP